MQDRKRKYYSIAGLNITLQSPQFQDTGMLHLFEAEISKPDLIYDVILTDEIPCAQGKLLFEDFGYEIYDSHDYRIRIMKHDHTKEIAMREEENDTNLHRAWFSSKYPEAWDSNMVLKIMNLPRQILRNEGVFIHSSFIVREEKAILFTANKQVGKSTQATLWEKYRGTITANGDRAILRKINGIWCACGSPYCGTSQICENTICPIEAIVILSQGKENIVSCASSREILIALLDNCSFEVWDKEQVERMMSLAEQIISEIPFVKLSCLPDESAVIALEEFLWKIKK